MVIKKFNQSELAQKIHANRSWRQMHVHQFWWAWPLWFRRYCYFQKRPNLLPAGYLVACLLQRFLNDTLDEIQAGVIWQAVRKKEIYTFFKDYVLTNLQALYWSSKVKYETSSGKLTYVSSNFLDFLYLAWLSKYKSRIESNFCYEERLVAAEHTMFKFDDLKVNPIMTDTLTDRMTTKVLSSHPCIICGETNN